MDAFFRHRVGEQQSWFCTFAYLGDRLIGVLPVVVSPHPIFGRARPLLMTPSDDITNSGDILLATEHAHEALTALLQEVLREQPAYLELLLPAVRQTSPLWAATAVGLPEHVVMKGRVCRYSKIDVAAGEKAYLDGLGQLKRNLRRYRKKLDERGPVSVEILTDEAAEPGFIHEFLELEASGWKGRHGSAIIQQPKDAAFYTRLVETFAARGRLEWHVIRVAGRVVAAGMGLRCGASVALPRIAFDETYSDCAPGTLLTGEVNAEAFRRGHLIELNHLSEAAWHRNWNMPQEEYVNLHLVRRSFTARLFHQTVVASRIFWHEDLKRRISPEVKTRIKALIRRGKATQSKHRRPSIQ
ncbi:hypothetical protein FOHLNKBM_5326 [Methylobacterium longum]|nr:hypothetical protein FOHLNKBM_5326 [Methylobacterium longum]